MSRRSSSPIGMRRGNNIPGFIAWQAGIYPVFAVPFILWWFTAEGLIAPIYAVIIGLVLAVVLRFLILSTVRYLLDKPKPKSRPIISLAGCGMAQFFYWGSPLLLIVLYWQGGLDMLALGFLLIPVLVVGVGIIATRMARS